MRDPARIRPLTDALARLWMSNPDLRFGQLVDIIMGGINDGMYIFVEDDVMIQRIESLDLSPSNIAGKYRGEI